MARGRLGKRLRPATPAERAAQAQVTPEDAERARLAFRAVAPARFRDLLDAAPIEVPKPKAAPDPERKKPYRPRGGRRR